MSRRAISKYIHIEAESGSEEEEFQSSEFSEDLDDITPAPRIQRYADVTKEIESRYAVDSSDEEEDLMPEQSVVEGPSQSQLIPTAKSPLLFLIRCKAGKEKNILLRIIENVKSTEICSVVQKEGLKGYIYIESFKKQSVEDVLLGIKNVSRRKIAVVPLGEMVEALTYKQNEIISEFARIKSGKYKGDLVHVLENYEDTVKVRLIPRINESKKYFDPAEYRNYAFEKDDGHIYNRDFYKDGFLIKTMLKNNLDFEVDPTFEELESLRIKGYFDINDRVRVKRGDLVNFVGKIEHISGNSATVLADDKRYEINITDLEKFYKAGEEVSYNGINGIILQVSDQKVILGINDLTEELKCNISDLKPAVPVKKEFTEKAPTIRGRKDPIVNSKVTITSGEYKGLKGVIKDVYKGMCRIQLETSLKHVNINRSVVQLLDDNSRNRRIPPEMVGISNKPEDENHLKTPGYKTPGFKTPGYQTPGYKTPGYQTPGYKTPGYQTPGYKTPGYQTPGYKTPGRGYDSEYQSKRTENAGTHWLMNKSIYDGVVIQVEGQNKTVVDFKDNQFVTSSGESIMKSAVKYVKPEKYENVVIMEGLNSGVEGILIAFKDDQCTIRSTKNGETFHVPITDVSKKI